MNTSFTWQRHSHSTLLLSSPLNTDFNGSLTIFDSQNIFAVRPQSFESISSVLSPTEFFQRLKSRKTRRSEHVFNVFHPHKVEEEIYRTPTFRVPSLTPRSDKTACFSALAAFCSIVNLTSCTQCVSGSLSNGLDKEASKRSGSKYQRCNWWRWPLARSSAGTALRSTLITPETIWPDKFHPQVSPTWVKGQLFDHWIQERIDCPGFRCSLSKLATKSLWVAARKNYRLNFFRITFDWHFFPVKLRRIRTSFCQQTNFRLHNSSSHQHRHSRNATCWIQTSGQLMHRKGLWQHKCGLWLLGKR